MKYYALKPLILNNNIILAGEEVKGMSKRMFDVNTRLGRIKKVEVDGRKKKENSKKKE